MVRWDFPVADASIRRMGFGELAMRIQWQGGDTRIDGVAINGCLQALADAWAAGEGATHMR